MSEKRTDELEDALGKTHAADFRDYLSENKDSLLSLQNSFSMYIKDIIHRSHLTQQTVFLMADIPERYGYKLLSGEKRTRRRDIILRICYAAQLTLDETQRALEKYGMPNRERRNLENYIGQAKNKSSVFMMHGADEIALSIVAEMEAKRSSYTPSIFIDYNDESTAARIMPYMATTNEANAVEKINFIYGVRVASRDDADFTLSISANDYESDTMNTRRANATRIKNLLDAGKSIALVDLAVHFREEETLLPLLIDEDAPIHRLAAYAGWNTASNSIGTALAEAVLFDIAKKRAATTNELIGASDKQLLFLDERFIEDCYYLKSTIDTINFSLRKEGYYDVNDLDLDHNTHWANDMLSKALKRRIDFLTSSRAYNMPMICTTPSGETLKFTVKNLKADAYFPWPRTFEIRLTTKHDLMTE